MKHSQGISPTDLEQSAASRVARANNFEQEDVVPLILEDHKPLKELLETLKSSDASLSKKRTAFDKFSATLEAHSKAEEESLYSCMRDNDEMRVNALEGDQEHTIAEELIHEISAIDSSKKDLWKAKVKVLAELVEHHIEEEEDEVLKQVKKHFGSKERKQIGEVYKQLLFLHSL